jgi:hypothetical protein
VPKQPIITLTDEIVPPPALVRAGLDALPAIIRAQGERASRRFIEFFTANIRNRNSCGGGLDSSRGIVFAGLSSRRVLASPARR